MQYEAVTVDASEIVNSISEHRVEQPTLQKNEQLLRLRRRTLILISIHLIIWFIGDIVAIVSLLKHNSKEHFQHFLDASVGLFIFVLGFVSVYRYSRTGISFFFWFLILGIVVGSIEILWMFFHPSGEREETNCKDIAVGVIALQIGGIYLVLFIAMLIAARKLYHEIKSSKQAAAVPV